MKAFLSQPDAFFPEHGAAVYIEAVGLKSRRVRHMALLFSCNRDAWLNLSFLACNYIKLCHWKQNVFNYVVSLIWNVSVVEKHYCFNYHHTPRRSQRWKLARIPVLQVKKLKERYWVSRTALNPWTAWRQHASSKEWAQTSRHWSVFLCWMSND